MNNLFTIYVVNNKDVIIEEIEFIPDMGNEKEIIDYLSYLDIEWSIRSNIILSKNKGYNFMVIRQSYTTDKYFMADINEYEDYPYCSVIMKKEYQKNNICVNTNIELDIDWL